MYPASDAFHQAVANGAHQIALLIFDLGSTDAELAVFTNDDINVSAGIEFNDYFNTEEDLMIGQTLSNEISFNLFNDKGLLNEYEFGEFKATIGAMTEETDTDEHKTPYLSVGDNVYTTSGTYPYIKRNGVMLLYQPSYPVVSMLAWNGNIYCMLQDGNVKVYQDSDGAVVSYTPNDFMKAQMQSATWRNKGFAFAKETVDTGITNNVLRIWGRYTVRKYEFVPLGVFVAERPNVPSVNEIHMTCYDEMQRFEKDMITDDELLTALRMIPGQNNRESVYPMTFGELFKAMCRHLDVPYRENITFVNSTAQITGRLDDFDNVTMREVLQWLAEAAGSIARIDRDGYLIMDWLKLTSAVIDETGYSEFSPYWYQTKKVTKLYNRASNGEYENSIGTGEETYLIQDNPLLKGVS